MKNKKTFNKRKAIIAILSIFGMLAVAIGGTIAFLTDDTGPLNNIFNRSVVSSTVNETFSNDVKSNVSIQNTGDTTSYIRAAIVVTWKNAENGAVYARKPVEGTDYYIELNTTDWFVGSDGFYYHKEPVEKGTSTKILINSCYPKEGQTPEGYGLNVEILGSAIQSVPTRVVTTNWNVTVNSSGNLQK